MQRIVNGIWLNLLAFLLFPLWSMAQTNLDSGLVAYYPFTDSAQDESGRDNHGTIIGAQKTQDRFGNNGRALYFDGAVDRVILGDQPDFRFPGDFSFSLWIYYPEDKGGNSILQRGIILQKRNENPPYNQYGLAIGELNCCWVLDTNQYASVFFRHDQNYDDKYLEMDNHPLAVGWHHFVVVHEKNRPLKAYLNNQLIGQSATGNGSFEVIGYPLMVGNTADPGIGDYAFQGAIDDIRIYNRKLTELEIDSLFMEDLSPTSRQELIQQSIRVFPNPSEGEFFMESASFRIEKIEAFDQLGRNVAIVLSKESQRFRLATTHQGLLHLRISTSGGICKKTIWVK